MKQHYYSTQIRWIGNLGIGTSSYSAYSRNFIINAEGKSGIHASSDVAFRGDPSLFNPEDLFVSSIASCHMLWYLHLCAINKIVVMEYQDGPEGFMSEEENGAGQFEKVILNPIVHLKEMDKAELALELHERAHEYCFIARSVNCVIELKPQIILH